MTDVVTEADYGDVDDGLGDSVDGSWAARAQRVAEAERAARESGRGKWQSMKMDSSDFGGPDAAPVDKCAFTYIAFMTLGIGLLLPWNAVLQSAGLFTSSAMFGPCSDIIFVLSAANMASILVIMIIMLYVNGRWKCNGRTFVAIGFLMRAVAIAVFAFGGTELSYLACVLLIVLNGVGGGFAQSALFGLSAILPPKYMSATMFGNGISGSLRFIVLLCTVCYVQVNHDCVSVRACYRCGDDCNLFHHHRFLRRRRQ